jgi:hypothetical protein
MICKNECAAAVDQTKAADCGIVIRPSSTPCRFATEKVKYEIDDNGRLTKSIAGASDEIANLPLDGSNLETVLYMPYQGDLILLCEVDGGESGWGLIFRLDSSLAIKWQLKFPAFNLSVGALEGHSLYQAGIGTVARIDLERGVYAWIHKGLYDPKLRSFNSFHKPEVGPDEVIFQEELASQFKGPARSIRVNKLSGKLQIE